MNVNIQSERGIKKLLLASLLGEGDLLYKDNTTYLCVPFQREKSYYLSNYLKSKRIADDIIVEPQKLQYKIPISNELKIITDEWHSEGIKIFNKKLSYKYLDFQTVILYINLFGSRKIEGIGLSTTVQRDFLKTLSYCLQQILFVDVLVGNHQLKIPDVPKLFMTTMDKISSIDSSEIAYYLNNQEQNRVRDIISKEGDYNYV